MHRSWIIWKLCITTTIQGHGCPFVDRAWTNSTTARYQGRAIVWPFGHRDKWRARHPRRAIVIGWYRGLYSEEVAAGALSPTVWEKE